jgi:hypothetical protein
VLTPSKPAMLQPNRHAPGYHTYNLPTASELQNGVQSLSPVAMWHLRCLTLSCAVQFVSSATGNLPMNSNDLNTLIQGVRATQVSHALPYARS